jgi:ABC-type transport system involved in cytochrome bd biosynthesis fused ATPase/permease subunit
VAFSPSASWKGSRRCPPPTAPWPHPRSGPPSGSRLRGEEEHAPRGDRTFPAGQSLRVRDLSFRYEGRPGPALDGLTATVPRGSLAVVEGPSGSGKSTLLRLIDRELAPERGEVLVGDTLVSAISEKSFRERLVFVSQDEHVFDATIRENLLLAQPGATDGDLRAALDAVDLTEFAEGLEDGLETGVGSHGHELSGGQRRRLCVARACSGVRTYSSSTSRRAGWTRRPPGA